jgi:hypothetical protein
MSSASRVEIEARLFILTYLGDRTQSEDLPDQKSFQDELLRMFPLERWLEQGMITEQQVMVWIAQALALLTSQQEPESE